MSDVPVAWRGELRLAFVDMDRVTFHRHPNEPEMELTPGRRYAAVFVEIADDESAATDRTAKVGRQRSPSNIAAILARDEDFQKWARDQFADAGSAHGGEPSEALATRFIKTMCDIDSRAELDTNPEALVAFQTRVEIPYYRTRSGI